MAKPREVRGWVVYGTGVSAAFLMLAFRVVFADGGSPFLIFPFVDIPFVIGVLAAALAALGLHQALWYFLVKPGGWTLYGGSLLVFVVALLLFYALPAAVADLWLYLLQFTGAFVLFLYVPALSYRSRVWLGIGVAGIAALLGWSLYGPLVESAPLENPLFLGTLAVEGLLVLTLLRLLQLAVQAPRATPA